MHACMFPLWMHCKHNRISRYRVENSHVGYVTATSLVHQILSGTGRGGVDDSYAQRGMVTERFITYSQLLPITQQIDGYLYHVIT